MTATPHIDFFPIADPQPWRFSILIPSWNNLAYLQCCVDSIRRNSAYAHQIIVHVNDGSDGTLDWVNAERLDHTYSADNVGVCHALNAAAQCVRTDYVVYMNDDMFVCPEWDVHLEQAIASCPDHKYYLSATMIEPVKTNNTCVLAPYDFGSHPDHFREAELLAQLPQLHKADWHGASWPPALVHRSLWEEVGGYDVAYSPGFGSDPDFSMKLWKAGVRHFRGIGQSKVYHFQSKSTGRVVRNDGRRTFTLKWGYTPSFFYKKVLRLGQTYDHKPLQFRKNVAYGLARCKGWLMALQS